VPTYNAIQTDRLENFVRRFLAVRNGGILPTVAPELGVEVTLPQLEDSMGLAGYIPWGTSFALGAGGAGTFNFVWFSNQTQTQLLVITPHISLGTLGNVVLAVKNDVVAPGGMQLTNGGWRDTRRNQNSYPSPFGILLQTGNVGAFPPAGYSYVYEVDLLAHTPWVFPTFVLAPQTSAIIVTRTANIGLTGGIVGYIRDLVADEDVI
jgi:hypothetical protein